MNDASFRRAQAMYDAQLPPGWDDDENPAELARECAVDIRERGLRLARADDRTVQGILALAAEEIGAIDTDACETGAEVADAIEKAAAAWELRANDPGPDPDDLYEETGRWSL